MGQGTLESQSLWYHYKTAVWPQKTSQTAIVHNIMKTLRSFRNLRQLAYVTVPVTTGRVYYDVLREHPNIERGELMSRVISTNYEHGWELVEHLVQCKACPILYPADLTPLHQDWEQKHFQALWLNIIAELCTEVHLCDGWNFSSGSVEEFTHVMQLRLGLPRDSHIVFYNTKSNEEDERERMRSIAVYDHEGNPVSIEQGIALVNVAIEELNDDFPTERLQRGLELLERTQAMLASGFYQ